VQLRYLSVDPYLRGRMKDIKSYFPGFQIGKVGNSGVVFQVLKSKSAKYVEGKHYVGFGQWSLRQLVNENDLQGFWEVPAGFSPSVSLGVLGMPGATSYFGYLELCKPVEGETLVVSGAAGAVGAIVCQLGKIKGCRVIGIAGSDAKCDYLKSIGCDAALNYKSPNLAEQIRNAAPKGVDQYFDNVGGEVKDAVFENLNRSARVSQCGSISQYNSADVPVGRNWDWLIITREIRIEGFIVTRWSKQWPEAFAEMGKWIASGQLKFEETLEHGLDNVITAFNRMMAGENTGKMVVVVD